ncbi:hypothetical protein DYB30_005913 [Aphanomyces astaci]|uniref:Glucosidase 2 subunit beta n=1 Tax=Aphanomyces astaci TaxID=112090 RepID=A0A397C3B7_APHAT|nr:hypothetical protein DYB30_005913 [Aphanomyces astaci]
MCAVDGIRFCTDHLVVDKSPQGVASFLFEHNGKLDKAEIGAYLGRPPWFQHGFCVEVLSAFAELLDFTDLVVDEAIRKFLAYFRLPGEAQQIGRDLHNPCIPVDKKMSKAMFVRCNQDVYGGGSDLAPDSFLGSIYDRIQERSLDRKDGSPGSAACAKCHSPLPAADDLAVFSTVVVDNGDFCEVLDSWSVVKHVSLCGSCWGHMYQCHDVAFGPSNPIHLLLQVMSNPYADHRHRSVVVLDAGRHMQMILALLQALLLCSLVHGTASASTCISALDGQVLDLRNSAHLVNDDYCDCVDGVDEPSTSACSHLPASMFHCRNEGILSLSVHTSRVHDGVCDCCDGTDERLGRCANTCHVEIGKRRERAMKDLVVLETGMMERQRRVRVLEAEDEKKAADLITHAAVQRELRQLKQKVQVFLDREARREFELQVASAKLKETVQNGGKCLPSDRHLHVTDTPPNEDNVVPQASTTSTATQASSSTEHQVASEFKQAQVKRILGHAVVYRQHGNWVRTCDDRCWFNGPIGIVVGLICPVDKYVYKVCPFEAVHQDKTLLGSWKRWQPQPNANEPLTMVFEDGERCWNGPSR